MTSRLVKFRKDSIYPEQWFGLIIEFVEAYHASARIVQHSLSDICKALNKKRVPSREQCISFIKSIKAMSGPLLSLSSAFEELARIPDVLIPFHLDIFMVLCNIQSQVAEVEAYMKKYYECTLMSTQQELIELRTETIHILTSFRVQLNKARRFLKNALGKKNVGMYATASAIPNREKENAQITIDSLTSILHSYHEKQIDKNHQVNAHNSSHKMISAYKRFLDQRRNQLLTIEEKKVEYLDPRNIPLELEKQEEHLRADIQRLQSEIIMLEQEGETS